MQNDLSNSGLMSRDYKYFEAARKAAGESTFKVHVGAVGVYQGKVIASAASQEKTHTMQRDWNRYRPFRQVGVCLPKLHAEIALLAKLRKLNVPMGRVKVYVYRVCKSRAHGIARPCPACLHALVDAGVREVYYTTDIGFCREYFDEEIINYKERGYAR